ncbi:MAG: hypothetical protein PHZ00_08075 [Candidatus Peribacteraceae bacterium]|nr:hypothetical protein [Candidatus Peribacteraceae bacterium]
MPGLSDDLLCPYSENAGEFIIDKKFEECTLYLYSFFLFFMIKNADLVKCGNAGDGQSPPSAWTSEGLALVQDVLDEERDDPTEVAHHLAVENLELATRDNLDDCCEAGDQWRPVQPR